MKKTAFFSVAVTAVLTAGAFLSAASMKKDTEQTSAASNRPAHRTITAREAKKMMTDNPDAIVVDVRTQAEYEEVHIPGAILLPNETIGSVSPVQLPDKDAVLLVYCRSGNRSRQAATKLTALGYTRVYDFGGIINWPYETVSGQ